MKMMAAEREKKISYVMTTALFSMTREEIN